MSDSLLEAAKGKPQCLAVMLCNEIIEDKLTNNKTLVSLFNYIAAPQLPVLHARMFVMVSLVEGEGTWPFAVSFLNPSGTEIVRLEGPVTFPNHEDVVDIVLEIRGLPLTEAGTYHIDVLVKDTLLSSRRFSVKLLEGEQS